MGLHKFMAIFIILVLTSIQIDAQDIKNDDEKKAHFIKNRGYSLEACYRLAEDYTQSQADQRKAIPYLEYIIESDKTAKPEMLYMLAQAYYYNGTYELAIKYLFQYIEKEKDDKLKKEAKLELEKFERGKKLASNPLNVILMNLGPLVNSKYADINPYISSLENLLVYSSKRGNNYNIYVSKKNTSGTLWEKSKLAGNYVNTNSDEFVAGLSPNGKELFVHYNQVSGFEDINLSQRSKGIFRELEDPGSKINSTYREEGACISQDESVMYFASDRPGGYGGFDIYYSLKLPEGNWGPSINLGKQINSPYDENYPNLSLDGKKLYFASKGHGSMGGFDIFYSKFDTIAQNFSAPVNMGYPINNAYDNKSIAFTENERYAYISTVDGNTLGDFDIYKVIFLDKEPEFLIIKAKVFVEENNDKKPFNPFEEELAITVYKDDETYGIYSFDKRNNSFVLALLPGEYVVEINSDRFKHYKKKITIEENYYTNHKKEIKVYLTRKFAN